jgi:hemolysin D
MFGKGNDQHEFKPMLVEIEEKPLNPLGRLVFWVILVALAFFTMWLVLGRVDVVVTARGKVIPAGEVKTVQPLNTGVVRSIRVKPGDLVEEGQVLMEIDPSDIDPELAAMRADRQQVALDLLRIEALLTGTEFRPDGENDPTLAKTQQDLYRAARERLTTRLGVKQQELRQLEEQLAAQQQILDQARWQAQLASQRLGRVEKVRDLVSRDEWEKTEREVREAETQRITAAHGTEELLAALGRVRREMALVRDEERNRLLTELAEKRQQRAYLDGRIEQGDYRSSSQQLASPVTGYVAQLLFHTVGGVVTPAEKLAVIVPADSPLVAKVLVSGRDVGFIAPSMDVTLKIDAFEFQKYGTLAGELRQVSRDSIEDEHQGLYYEALVQPRQTTLLVEGRETAITSGMGVTAEIKVGKRRIIEFFIYPLIKHLDEGISVR